MEDSVRSCSMLVPFSLAFWVGHCGVGDFGFENIVTSDILTP